MAKKNKRGRKSDFYERRRKLHYPQVEKTVEKRTVDDVLAAYRAEDK